MSAADWLCDPGLMVTSLSLGGNDNISLQALRGQTPASAQHTVGPGRRSPCEPLGWDRRPTGWEVLSCGQGTGQAALSSFRQLVAVERDTVNGGNEKRPDAVQATARKGRLTQPPIPPRLRKGKAAQTGKWSISDDHLTGTAPALAGSGRPLPTPHATPGPA